MQQKELAAALGISPAMVSKLKKMNMPTDTVEKAQRWRKRHLEPGRIKGSRFDPTQVTKLTAPNPATPDKAAAAVPGVSVADFEAAVADVEAAGAELDNALTTGDQAWADVMLQQVRDFLRLIPDDSQPRLSLRVWLALVDRLFNSDHQIFHATDKTAPLTPGEFGARWPLPTSGKNALFDACDWNDVSIKGWPTYPDDDKLDAMTAEA